LQAAFEAALAVSDEPKRAATKLKAGELEEFRQMLLLKRAQLIGDVEQLSDDAHAGNRSDASGDLSSMPIHMADIGSDNWDQEFNLVLLQNERNLLREIDDALERIKEGTYGICLATGRPISKARLRAKPWAKYCIEYARKKEIGHG
jgi:RNA polymerase-binding protein DksA